MVEVGGAVGGRLKYRLDLGGPRGHRDVEHKVLPLTVANVVVAVLEDGPAEVKADTSCGGRRGPDQAAALDGLGDDVQDVAVGVVSQHLRELAYAAARHDLGAALAMDDLGGLAGDRGSAHFRPVWKCCHAFT